MSAYTPGRPRRVAICGFFLECNRWSPVSTAQDFQNGFDWAGEALAAELRRQPPRLLGETVGFVAEMDRLGPWQAVPLRMAAAWPGGPVDARYFEDVLEDLDQRLRAAGRVDETGDLDDAAAMIARAKVFDYATSCLADNALVAHEKIYDALIGKLVARGGHGHRGGGGVDRARGVFLKRISRRG